MHTHKKAQDGVGSERRSAHQAVLAYEPTLEEIRARAYEVFVERGRIDGFDLEDWLQAEKDLRENGNKRTE